MTMSPQRHKPPKVGTRPPRDYHKFYRFRIWKARGGLRDSQLNKQPLCEDCLKVNQVTAATDVDHIVPHRGAWSLFSDAKNLQSLCKACHSRKTSRGE